MNGTKSGYPEIRAFLFDMDRTLIDSKDLINKTLRKLFLQEQGRDMDEQQLMRFHGMPARLVLAEINPHRVEALFEHTIRIMREMRPGTHLFPGTRKMLHGLHRQGYLLGAITSASRVEMEDAREYYRLDPYFQAWISSDDVKNPKPDPEPVRRALELLGPSPDEVLVIGDTTYDMLSGKAASTLVGAAMWGAKDPEGLLRVNPDYVFHHPLEILDLVEEQHP